MSLGPFFGPWGRPLHSPAQPPPPRPAEQAPLHSVPAEGAVGGEGGCSQDPRAGPLPPMRVIRAGSGQRLPLRRVAGSRPGAANDVEYSKHGKYDASRRRQVAVFLDDFTSRCYLLVM